MPSHRARTLVKFSDAGVGAGLGRARRLSPALENLPRTKPRGAVAALLWGKQVWEADVPGLRHGGEVRLTGSGGCSAGGSGVDP